MQELNLPPVEVDLKIIEGKYHIFDVIRKKFIVLTPEEWVRQHVVIYLQKYHSYPRGLISVESGLKYNKLAKRTDILVYDHTGAPFLLVECKSFEIRLTEKTVQQAATYNKVLQAPYLMVTNGKQHYCCQLNTAESTYNVCDSIPPPPKK